MNLQTSREVLEKARLRCETEPFLQPAGIEPHGLLIAFAGKDLRIRQLSANAGPLLARSLDGLLDQPLQRLLSPTDMTTLSAALAAAEPPAPLALELSPCWQIDDAGPGCHAWLHRADGLSILELEPRLLPPAALSDLYARLHRAIQRLNASADLEALYQALTDELRRLCGVDQVAVYRFEPSGHGTVVAEDRASHMPSYLDLRFPASDVPQQVRRHAMRHTARMMPDLAAEAVALVPAHNPLHGEPLDQAGCQLRGAHLRVRQYYRNMGVGSVLALSVVQAGRLWGYVCALHPAPRLIDAEVRRACQILVGNFAALLHSREALQHRTHRHRLQTLMEQLLVQLVSAEPWYRGLMAHRTLLLELLDAHGVVLRVSDHTLRLGITPDLEQLEGLLHWLDRRCESRYCSDRLAEDYPPALSFRALGAGLLAIGLSEAPGGWLLWFRPEIAQTVRWAGRSENILELDEHGEPLLSPRRSFAEWVELVRGTSLPFREIEVELARELQLWLLDRLRIDRLTQPSGQGYLHWTRERLNGLLGLMRDFIWQAAPQDLRIHYISPAVEQVTGYAPREFLQEPGLWSALIHPEDRDSVLLALRTRAVGAPFDLEYRILHRDGRHRWLHNRGKIVHDEHSRSYVLEGIATDISSRKHVEQQLYRQANYDALTGLPNRSLTLDRLAKLCEGQRRQPVQPFAVCFLDVDRFKWINDSLGHEAGDQVLIHVAEQLRLSLRPGDTVGRMGGDEFVLLLPALSQLEDVLRIAQRIRDRLNRPLTIEQQELRLKSSIGIVLVDREVAPEQILRQADAAMYIAKRNGDLYRVFDAQVSHEAQGQLELLRDFPAALAGQQFQVFYQPVMDLREGGVWGFEVLLRWQHPGRGLLMPAEFMPVVENLPAFQVLGFSLLARVAKQLALWNRDRDQPLMVSINVSTRQLLADGFVEQLLAVLGAACCDPRWLCLDVTEDALLANVPLALQRLEALREQGLRVFVDDFGMGYSSLSYLHRFPVMGVKIDRSVVARLDASVRDATIARAIVVVAGAMDLLVIAEGVESLAVLETLRAMGCGLGQGYHFARPLPLAEAERWQWGDPAADGVLLNRPGKTPE